MTSTQRNINALVTRVSTGVSVETDHPVLRINFQDKADPKVSYMSSLRLDTGIIDSESNSRYAGKPHLVRTLSQLKPFPGAFDGKRINGSVLVNQEVEVLLITEIDKRSGMTIERPVSFGPLAPPDIELSDDQLAALA